MTLSTVTVQTTPESQPSTPGWMGEVAAFAQILSQTGLLTRIEERVRFARARMGTYDLIDFVVVLMGYALSGEPTLRAFYNRLLPFADPFMALFGRKQLPSRSALSRWLATLDQASVESLRTLFQEDLLARTPFADPGGIRDRCGQSWLVADVDGTRKAARQRALPQAESLPAPHRRFDQVCAKGYQGRKRGEVVRVRTVVLQAHTHQFLGTFGGAGNGDYRGELLRAIGVLKSYARQVAIPIERHALFEQVRDEMLLDWWQHYYEPMDAHQQREVTSSVITKLSKFASSRLARRILGQPRSMLDLNALIRAGQLLLVSTASGVVGTDLSELIGIVLLGLFESALAEQASLPPEERRRYLVLIDEFQVYRGANYQMMLAELRKYGGSFGLATQSLSYLDRLDHTLRSTVLANIDHLFAFHMAGEDARLLHELDGIAEDDITNLDDFQCYVKLSLGGRRLPVFSLNLDAPPCADAEVATMIRQRSQQRDARPVGVVNALIQQSRVRQQQPGTPRTSRGRKQETQPVGELQEPGVDDATDGHALAGGSARKRRKRGGSSRSREAATIPAAYRHVMYDEEASSTVKEHEEQTDEPESDGEVR